MSLSPFKAMVTIQSNGISMKAASSRHSKYQAARDTARGTPKSVRALVRVRTALLRVAIVDS
ncbi:hypothetical protein [Fodinicola feengrottensis]|uniref:hypothetical protein n=1 Tax=Fodinicola feengrottensis TaxID=435914 RepID=UPI0024435377|nr:hypothetical protein [Fodinicola feengrottensis]